MSLLSTAEFLTFLYSGPIFDLHIILSKVYYSPLSIFFALGQLLEAKENVDALMMIKYNHCMRPKAKLRVGPKWR